VRTLIGFIVAFLLAKIVGTEAAASLSEPVQAGVVVVTSALFAWLGKTLRNRDNAVGKVV
jgi:hypothetical protein